MQEYDHVEGTRTSERRVRASLQIHLTVPPFTHFLGVVAHVVAAVLAAAQADPLLEAVGPGALVRIAGVVLTQGVDK